MVMSEEEWKEKCRREMAKWQEKCRREMIEWQEKCRREMIEWQEKCRREMIEWNTKNIWAMEMFRSVIMAGQAAIKSAILINGGAAVALLAFTGHVFTTSKCNKEVTAKLAGAMACFVVGVVSGAVASGAVYLAQFVYARDKIVLGHIFNNISRLLVISCYILFVIGAILAFGVF